MFGMNRREGAGGAGDDRRDTPRGRDELERNRKDAASEITGPDALPGNTDLGPGTRGGSISAGTATGIGGSGGDARTSGESATGGAGVSGAPSGGTDAADAVGAGGPATPVGGGGATGASAGTGRGSGGTTGVTGMGSSAIGHPQGPTAGDVSGRPVEPSVQERRQGVTEQRETSIIGNAGLPREAGLPSSAAGPSGAMGAGGSGSTTEEPGGLPTGQDPRSATVGGTGGLGMGGTTPSGTEPSGTPLSDAGLRGAGARGDEEGKAAGKAVRPALREQDERD
jgi:hypothetical protein